MAAKNATNPALIRLEILQCRNPAGRCKGPVLSLDDTTIIGGCGGPYRVLSTHWIRIERLREILDNCEDRNCRGRATPGGAQ